MSSAWVEGLSKETTRKRQTMLVDACGRWICAYREYFDKGVQLVRLGFSPESLARVLGRGVPAIG